MFEPNWPSCSQLFCKEFTTPHMCIVSPQGQLIYAGGIDSVPSARVDDINTAKRYNGFAPDRTVLRLNRLLQTGLAYQPARPAHKVAPPTRPRFDAFFFRHFMRNGVHAPSAQPFRTPASHPEQLPHDCCGRTVAAPAPRKF